MKRAFANKVDVTAKALIAHAKTLDGVQDYCPINGVIDGLLLINGRIAAVDWKGDDGALTPAQQRLIVKGWPIHFCATPERLEGIVAILKRFPQ